jgi:hypothetical protein
MSNWYFGLSLYKSLDLVGTFTGPLLSWWKEIYPVDLWTRSENCWFQKTYCQEKTTDRFLTCKNKQTKKTTKYDLLKRHTRKKTSRKLRLNRRRKKLTRKKQQKSKCKTKIQPKTQFRTHICMFFFWFCFPMFSRFHQLFLQNQDFAIIFFGVFWFLLLFLFSFFLSCLKLYYFSKMIKRNKSRLNRRLNSGLEFAWFLGVWIVQHFCPSFSVKMSIGQPICCFSCFFPESSVESMFSFF